MPAPVVSPFAKKGYVVHPVYDTGSILRLGTRVFGFEMLDGLKLRDDAMRARTDGAPTLLAPVIPVRLTNQNDPPIPSPPIL